MTGGRGSLLANINLGPLGLQNLGLRKMDQQVHEKLKRQVEDLEKRSRWVIMPANPRMELWSIAILLALSYTFIVTPFQVAFVYDTPAVLFGINRVVDFIFLVDLVLQFFIAYRPHPLSPHFVTSLPAIQKRYLLSWFTIDVLSLLSSFVEISEQADGSNTNNRAKGLQSLRFLRILRLFRILRLVRVTNVVAGLRLIQRVVRSTFGLPHISIYVSELGTWVFMLVMIAHAVACLWGYVSLTVDEVSGGLTPTWVSVLLSKQSSPISRDSPMSLYLLSLYWSLVTLATIGYGDITPQCIEEYTVATLVILFSATVWTMLMASACSVIGLMNDGRLKEGQEMEVLMKMCTDYELSTELVNSLKAHVVERRRFDHHASHMEVMGQLPPQLHMQVADTLRPYLLRIPFIKDPFDTNELEESAFLSFLARALRPKVCAPARWVVPDALESDVTEEIVVVSKVSIGKLPVGKDPHLTIMRQGVAMHNCVLGRNAVWHDDCIIADPRLRDYRVAQAVGFCAVYTLDAREIWSPCDLYGFPKSRARIRKYAVRLATTRLVKLAAEVRREEMKLHNQTKQSLSEAVDRALEVEEQSDEEREDSVHASLAALQKQQLDMQRQQDKILKLLQQIVSQQPATSEVIGALN